MSINKFDSGGIYPPPQTPDNEVARLRWEIKISADGITPYLWDNRKYDNYDLGSLCRILNEYEEKTNEVARLRELLNRAIDNCECEPKCSSHFASYCDCGRYARNEEIRKELARRAPAPEEPAGLNFIPTEQAFRDVCARADNAQTELLKTQKELTAYKRMVDSLREQNSRLAEARLAEAVIKESLTTEPAPEWRELGQGEVIQEGDEVKGVGGEWFKVEQTIGAKAGKCGSAIFRTRRPLPDPVPTQQPTQNEWRELGKDEVIREGDEEMHRDGWIWFPVATPDIGLTPSDHRNYSFRTRRPLPKQEGEQPYCSRCKYNHAFPCEGSLAGVPLETPLDLDIEEIEAVANHPFAPRVDFYTRQLAMRSAHAICYLRDEIEQLKKNQK